MTVVAAALLALLVEPASAVVNQVDGLVVPIQVATVCPGADDNCIQTGLNLGEGANPPSVPPTPMVHAVLDANTGPETFLIPKELGKFVTVTFRLLEEGAGFENIFGWYNVGEPQKRFPVVFSCRNGAQSLYEPPTPDSSTPPKYQGGFVATVDFEAEFLAGRYKGKQLGFYLVTPEGNATGSSCAADPLDQGVLVGGVPSGPINDDNIGNAADDANGLGRVYFTESKLNNDGNYVHYLIYQSKKNAKHFYFGFEDLFRGGDNDYDDTLVKVEGLVPTCQPGPEICNGVDDNCNGAIDENVFRECVTACGKGQEKCAFTNDGNPANDWIDCDAPKPKPEDCNGLDDDCDGTPDNNLPKGAPCTLGACKGEMTCVGGKWVCGAAPPSTELCDGKDNNCNGAVDENLTRPCLGPCGPGVETCAFSDDGNPANDWVGCSAPKPETEVCDGVDNDCNGKVDDGVAGEGLPCDHPSGKTCQQGKTKCVGGKMTCAGATTSGSAEICDCKDNNCNNQIDENNPCPTGTTCVDCGCRIKCSGVEFGCPKGYACKNGFCVPDVCAAVSCKAGERCLDGKCVSLCDGVSCTSGKVCVAGFCVEDSCYGKGCPAGQVCLKSACVPDPCANVTCKSGEYCKAGSCRPSCGHSICGRNGRCEDGLCLPEPCAGLSCPPNVPCVEGKCDLACAEVACGKGRICRGGVCLDDPCTSVRCYDASESCAGGQCVSDLTSSGSRSELLASGGGGCSCELAAAPPAAPLALLGVLLLLLLRRRGRDGGAR